MICADFHCHTRYSHDCFTSVAAVLDMARRGNFPHVERACERVLSLPLFPEMKVEQVEYAAKTLAEIAGKR